MGQRYTVDFQIEPGAAAGAELLEAVANTATEWLRERTKLPLAEATGQSSNEKGRVALHADRDGRTAVYRFEWTVAQDDSEWTTELQLSTSGDEVDLHAAVRNEADSPDQNGVEGVRLALIGDLVEQFDCRRLGERLHVKAQRLNGAGIDAFIEGLLGEAERIPLIAVSLNRNGRPSLDPDALQRGLAGLAHVYLLDGAASARLSERVGHRRSCYAGAVRLYAPGFADGDAAARHPFWLANQVRAQGRGFWREIAAQAGQMALPTSPSVAFYLRQDEIRSAELERIREAAPDETLEQQVKSLQRLVEGTRSSLIDVIAERDRFQNLYEQAQRKLDSQQSDEERQQSEQTREPGTVLEAVQIADDQRGEHLYFLNSAFESAEESRYPAPRRVLEALSALHQLGQLLAQGDLAAAQIVQWLNDKNFECSTESEDTMRRYGQERRFPDAIGLDVEMPLHIKLGGGAGQDNMLRIHFKWDAEYGDHGQILVGHVGRHLRTSRS